MIDTTKEYHLDNLWRVKFSEDGVIEDGAVYCLKVEIFRLCGTDCEKTLRGWVKKYGCQDWGAGDNVIMHFCGRQDTTLLSLVFDDAMILMEDNK